MRKIVQELMRVEMGVVRLADLNITLDMMRAYYQLYQSCWNYVRVTNNANASNMNAYRNQLRDDAEAYINVVEKIKMFGNPR